ncbi:ThiF family adenylyltransferase [Microbacterium sp. STN6]|uniref:ThiF family adenylyltransferase n=1 Tax=Microbacterium sp. STN6 TaxID=2995588 RepID=UPI002260A291|nr:ThiF family adenylyltransferase [Microbacterium sp. STN6]MCX7520881.1 ThiF family adenylyltransferase [Microbacterium sp. STN6]
MGMLPPLVSPGPPLEPARLARYSRQLMLPGFGEEAQRRLAHSRVLVVGAGGLGSASIPQLAAAGVGTIGVVDDDTVELTNLHRQTAHALADVGRAKVDSIAETVAAIDPGIVVHRHAIRLTSGNIMALLADYDLVLDGSDNFATRYLTNDATALSHKPLVWGAILRYGGQASVAWADAGPTYRDLFPVPPAPGDVPSCSEAGVLPGVCTAIGSIMATETVKLITGIGDPLIGRVTTYDALTGRYRELEYGRDPEAPRITRLIDYEAFCAARTPRGSSSAKRVSSPAIPAQTPQPTDAGAPPTMTLPSTPGRVSPAQLARRIADGEPLQLIDVREPFEAAIASIAGSQLMPLGGLVHALDRVRRDVPVVVYCHSGVRSLHAARILQQAGIAQVDDLEGGIDAWSREIDPALPRY